MSRRFPRFVRYRNSRRNTPPARSVGAETFEARILMSADGAALQRAEFVVEAKWFEQLEVRAESSLQKAGISEQTIQWQGRDVTASNNEWIVQFTPESSIGTATEARQFFQQARIPVTVVGGLGTSGQMLIRTEGMTTDRIVQALGRRGEVSYVEPNFLVAPQRTANDPGFPLLTGLHQTNDQDIDAPEAWDVTTGNANVVVGVIDTGVDYRHPDLRDNMWVNPGEIPGDRIDNDQNGFTDDVHGFDFFSWDGDPIDGSGHGTHVAGTIAAVGNNGVGTTGVAWDASIMALQIFDQFGNAASTASIVAAVNYVTMMKVNYGANVRVTNNSWGGGEYSQALKDAIDLSGQADILFVAAAGNGGSDFVGDNNDQYPQYPASYTSDNIISVGAIDQSGRYARFSNYGATSVDIAAPGVEILSTLPGGQYGYSSGTSMATPHVAGTVVLAAAANPELDYRQIRQTILSTSDLLIDQSRPITTRGRLNANRTVRTAIATAGPADRFAVFRPQSATFIYDTGREGFDGEQPLQFGLPGDLPISGDWNGDGRDEPGVFRSVNGYTYFYLDTGKPGYSGELPIQFGLTGDQPIAGDWNGDGRDEVGVFRPGNTPVFFLDTGAPGYQGELPFQFGLNGDKPIAGDWNGDGRDEVGVFRPNGALFFRDSGRQGYDGELPIQLGLNGDLPVTGDWNGDGKDDVGVFRPSTRDVFLDRGTPGFNGEVPFKFGVNGDQPVAGRWIPRLNVTPPLQPLSRQKGTMRLSAIPVRLVEIKSKSANLTADTVSMAALCATDIDIENVKRRPITGHRDQATQRTKSITRDSSPQRATSVTQSTPVNARLLDDLFEEVGNGLLL